MTDRERRDAVNAALQAMGNRNRATLTFGMSRDEANERLRAVAFGHADHIDVPVAPPDEPEAEHPLAAGGSLDGGVQGQPVPEDPRDTLNRLIRREFDFAKRGYE